MKSESQQELYEDSLTPGSPRRFGRTLTTALLSGVLAGAPGCSEGHEQNTENPSYQEKIQQVEKTDDPSQSSVPDFSTPEGALMTFYKGMFAMDGEKVEEATTRDGEFADIKRYVDEEKSRLEREGDTTPEMYESQLRRFQLTRKAKMSEDKYVIEVMEFFAPDLLEEGSSEWKKIEAQRVGDVVLAYHSYFVVKTPEGWKVYGEGGGEIEGFVRDVPVESITGYGFDNPSVDHLPVTYPLMVSYGGTGRAIADNVSKRQSIRVSDTEVRFTDEIVITEHGLPWDTDIVVGKKVNDGGFWYVDNVENVTQTRHANEEYPGFTADGRVVFLQDSGKKTSGIWAVDYDGRNKQLLAQAPNPERQVITMYYISPDGRRLVYNVVDSEARIQWLWLMGADGSGKTNLHELFQTNDILEPYGWVDKNRFVVERYRVGEDTKGLYQILLGE